MEIILQNSNSKAHTHLIQSNSIAYFPVRYVIPHVLKIVCVKVG